MPMLAIPYSLFVGIVAEPISVELHGGAYALFEVKMGAWEIDDGAASLLKLARKVDASVMGPPHSAPSSPRAGTPTAERTGSS